MNKLVLLSSLLVSQITFSAESKISQDEYVNTWKNEAVLQMSEHKIPASITMAQAILESGNGNSRLAREGNNHFGIKCHEWTGAKMYLDDDKANECFRVYKNANESFEDHSLFLTQRSRYASLFSFQPTDYKNWAKGLKAAGYATNPKYPDLLIDLIERLKLNELDQIGGKPTDLITQGKSKQNKSKNETSITISEHRSILMHTNNLRYVVAKKGDTFYKLSKELKIDLWQLYRFNDFGDEKDVLNDGDLVFLQAKKGKSKTKDKLEVKAKTTLRELSQNEGVKLKSLLKKNPTLKADDVLSIGEIIRLK